MPDEQPTPVFFSHASEDKPAVEAVYARLIEYAPKLDPWLDKYEILAGQSLIDRIAAGIDSSQKFVIFLSPTSIRKPWVDRELKRALMREIDGVDPDFIIPVVLGDVPRIPAFLEDKKYIALHKLTEPEWLAALTAAIEGQRPRVEEPTAENVAYRIVVDPSRPNVAHVEFAARFWAAPFSFAVYTSSDIISRDLVGSGIFHEIGTNEGPRTWQVRFSHPELRPGYPLAFKLEFGPGVDAASAVQRVEPF